MGSRSTRWAIELDDSDEEPSARQSLRAPPRDQNVLLEAANWNFINLRRTMQSQKMTSEAGLRFSRGVHPAMAIRGLLRGIEMMRQSSGGVVAQGIIDEYPLPAPTIVVDLPLSEVDRLLGIPIPPAEIVGHSAPPGIRGRGDAATCCTSPCPITAWTSGPASSGRPI